MAYGDHYPHSLVLYLPARDIYLNITVISKGIVMMVATTDGMCAVWHAACYGLNSFLHLTAI